MKKRGMALLIACAMLLSACACALAQTTFIDDLGREVVVPEEISRLVVSGARPQS